MSDKDIEFYRSQPELYSIESNGAVRDRGSGKIIAIDPSANPYSITKENTAVMHEIKRQKAQIGILRGLARAAGVKMDEATLEQIAQGAGTAIENMTEHFYNVFMKSGNVRGMAEAYRGLVAPMLGEEDREVIHRHEVDERLIDSIQALLEAIQKPQAISGKVID